MPDHSNSDAMVRKGAYVICPDANDARKTYRVVANHEVTIDPQAEQVATMIYEHPISRVAEEGLAILREAHGGASDSDFWAGLVEFCDEPGPWYFRLVYRRSL